MEDAAIIAPHFADPDKARAFLEAKRWPDGAECPHCGVVGEACAAGEQAFIEIAVEGRATSMTRACVTNSDAAGRLAQRLSELGGSRTEEELAAAGLAELMAADRAFAAKAAADGVPDAKKLPSAMSPYTWS